MIELVTQAYMLMAPVGLAIVCLCIAELTRERQERAGRALYAGFKRWLTDGGGGYSGAAVVDPRGVRAPSSPSGVQRIGGYQPTKVVFERVEPSPDRVPPRGGSGMPKRRATCCTHGVEWDDPNYCRACPSLQGCRRARD